MGRTSDAREKLIEAASQLIFSRGYNAVGVNELCEAAGVKKGSFYHFFRSKAELVQAVVEDHLQRMQAHAEAAPDATPGERLTALMAAVQDDYVSQWRAEGQVLGCPFGNLAAELSTQEEPVRKAVVGALDRIEGRLAELMREATAAGELHIDDPERRAAEVMAMVQGAAILAKARGDASVFEGLMGGLPALLLSNSSS